MHRGDALERGAELGVFFIDATNGPSSPDDVSGTMSIGSPFSGSGMVFVEADVVHSPSTKFAPF